MNRKWILVLRSMPAAFLNPLFHSLQPHYILHFLVVFFSETRLQLAKRTFNSLFCMLQGLLILTTVKEAYSKKNKIFVIIFCNLAHFALHFS